MTTVTTICTNEVGEYSAWRHVERHELEVYCRRSENSFRAGLAAHIATPRPRSSPSSMRPVCAALPNAPRVEIRMLTPEED